MRRYFFAGLIFSIAAVLFAAQQYTVVLKNGKTMTGTLISESADGIIFKDTDGVQFSLKKSALDLEKMQQANAIQAPPIPMQEEELNTAPKKKGRVYTKEDIEQLKTKYGELITAEEAVENVEDYEGGVLKPEAHFRQLKGSTGRLTEAVDNLTTVGNGIATAWEVADSTGKDADEAIKGYVSDQTTAELIAKANSQIAALEDTRDRLSGGPEQYANAYKALTQAVDALKSYQRLVQDRSTVDNASLYRSRMQEISNQVNSAATALESLQPQEAAKKTKPAAPAQEPTQPAVPEETQEAEEAAPGESPDQTQTDEQEEPNEDEEETEESPDR